MKEVNMNGKDILLSEEEIDDIIRKHPKQVFVISPEGKRYVYTVPFKKHHCEVYGDLIKEINEDLNLNWTNQLVDEYNKCEKNIEDLNRDLIEVKEYKDSKIEELYKIKGSRLMTKVTSNISQKLLGNNFFICHTFVNIEDLNHYCLFLSKFDDKIGIQKEKILELFFDLNLDSYDKIVSNDNNIFKKNVFEVKRNRISK